MLALYQKTLVTWIGTVLCEAAGHGHSMGFKVLAEQDLATTTVEAFAAKLGIIGDNSLSQFKAFYILAHGCDDPDRLMTRDEGKLGQELALMDMQIRAADSAGFDLDKHIIVSQLREVDLDDAVLLRLGVPIAS